MTERTGAAGAAGTESVPGQDGGAVVNLGDGWESDDRAVRRPEDEAGRGVVTALVAADTAVVRVRDSKAAAGPVVTVSRAAWAGFVGLASSERVL
ncbi:DUF397 domain-containing protein [Streptomyces bluensis]|uniref:DUF397 domain-containing protein n=1 Tax=Streptomyces bluensis TaxID=33897 RepID=A0ABW6UE80_9ACTN